MKIQKFVMSTILLIILVAIYSIVSIHVIDRLYNPSFYEKEISEMKTYAHDIALGNVSEFEESYEIMERDIRGIGNSTKSACMNIILKSSSDIKLIVKYNVEIIGNSFIIDEENPSYTISNPNRSGSYVLLIIVLFVFYFRFRHIINSVVEKHHKH